MLNWAGLFLVNDDDLMHAWTPDHHTYVALPHTGA